MVKLGGSKTRNDCICYMSSLFIRQGDPTTSKCIYIHTRVSQKIRGIWPLTKISVTPSFHRLLRSSPLGHCCQPCPRGLLRRKRWKQGVTKKILMDKFPEFSERPSYVRFFTFLEDLYTKTAIEK
jgi:hypothetical protein